MRMKYDIVVESSAQELVKKVNKKLEEDWFPLDGARKEKNIFYQTMVKLPNSAK